MFFETICIKNAAIQNLAAHVLRMRQTADYFGFSVPVLPCLLSRLPDSLRDMKVKCRVEYGESIGNIEFIPYTPKIIRSLKLVNADDIDYSFKFSDRSQLDVINKKSENCSEVLIVKNGRITDTTYSNVAFEKNNRFFTPDTCLLNGTKRQKLLRETVVSAVPIGVDNLHEFDHVYLINSMLDIEDGVRIPIFSVVR